MHANLYTARTSAQIAAMDDAAIMAPANDARLRLTRAAASADADSLNYGVLELAYAEGAARAMRCAALMLTDQDDRFEGQARQALIQLLLAKADDTYSGRGNDVRRARHDGMTAQVHELLDMLTREDRAAAK